MLFPLRMKFVILSLFALLLLPVVSIASTQSCFQPPSGLVSWWPAESDATDHAGSNHGSLEGDGSYSTGMVGQAFSFQGTTGRVVVPSASSLNITGSMTIDAWIYPTADGVGHIVAKWGDAGSWAYERAYSFHTLPGLGLRFALSDAAHQDDGAFHMFDSPSNVITLYAWNHVAAVYDQTTGNRKMYVNGVLVAERTDEPITLTASIADLGIGAQMNIPGSYALSFVGLIDEVEIYNRALSAEEIAGIFNAGSAGRCTTITVLIDVKPRSANNVINTKSEGTAPVAIYSSADLDATTIDPRTITLAGAHVRNRGRGIPMASRIDVNGDGLIDLLIHVDTRALSITGKGVVQVTLEGKTFSGVAVQGTDTVRIVH